MNFFETKLKLNDYFENLITKIDLKVEELIEKFHQTVQGSESDFTEQQEKLNEIDQARAKFLEVIYKCRQKNIQYLDEQKEKGDVENFNYDKCLKQACFFLNLNNSSVSSSFFGILVVVDCDFVKQSDIIKKLFTNLNYDEKELVFIKKTSSLYPFFSSRIILNYEVNLIQKSLNI